MRIPPLLYLALALACFAAVVRPQAFLAAWHELERIIQLRSDPLPASPARLSGHEVEELAAMPAQQQVERLLERAINHYQGAIELIGQSVEGWKGGFRIDHDLGGLLETALNANDLRVRAAAVEIYLSAYGMDKDSATVDSLLRVIHSEPDDARWDLWMLGSLGNRGVAPDRVEAELLERVQDSDPDRRGWAVEGLGMLATDACIPALLGIFRKDPSMYLRERAACHLAQSGMLTGAQRMTAVSELIGFAEDASLDETTRGWVYQALRDISGESFPSEPAPWRYWWSRRP